MGNPRIRQYISLKLWPVLTALGGAAVMLLAFLVPSLQDQWDRYQSRKVISQYEVLGDGFMGDENYAMAEQAYAKAVELSEEKRLDIEAKRLEARVAQMSQLAYWGDSIPGDLAEVDFQFLLHLRGPADSSRAQVLSAYGMFLAARKRYAEAEAAFAQAIALRPADALIRINHGNLLDEAGQAEQAAAEYREAIRLDHGLPEARFNLGLLLAVQDSIGAALRELREAARLAPDDTAIAARLKELGGRAP